VGALVAPLDDRGLDVPDARDRARQHLGLLRARLGRLVVLGSGRERVLHAMARRHRADPFTRSD
jgi:cytochrome c-type biogenesis protein CcmF